MSKIDVTVILPVYNEERTIKDVIAEIKHIMDSTDYNYEIIAVNDASQDNTGKILNQIKDIRVIHHPYNKGYGSSLKTAIRNSKSNLMVMTDSDGTYPIEEIPKLLKYADNYDLVTGVRVKSKIPLTRRPAKFILSKLANFLTEQKIPDLNCGLRVIKKDNVEKFFKILPSRFSFTITHLLACLNNDYNVKFVPISYRKRKSKSTIHPIKDFIRFNTVIIRVITYFKPFKFFLISAFLLFFGFLVFLYSLLVLHRIMDITVVVLVLASLQVFLFGLIADLIVKSR
jgi:glycosyltransferase involved in cell wall biosynthesis